MRLSAPPVGHGFPGLFPHVGEAWPLRFSCPSRRAGELGGLRGGNDPGPVAGTVQPLVCDGVAVSTCPSE